MMVLAQRLSSGTGIIFKASTCLLFAAAAAATGTPAAARSCLERKTVVVVVHLPNTFYARVSTCN